MLEYTLGDERSYLWAVTKTSMTTYQLPGRAMLEESARGVYHLLTARQPAPGETGAQYRERIAISDIQYRQEAAALGQMLLGPVAAQLGAKRLLVIPDGALQYLPFDALPVPAGPEPAEGQSAATATGGEFSAPLMLEHEVVNIPSIAILSEIRREESRRISAHNTIAVLADPVFDNRDPRLRPAGESGAVVASERDADVQQALRVSGETDGKVQLARLPSTLREARAIIALAPEGEGLLATGVEASRDRALSSELGQYRIVHFATHGFIDSEHPELSGIILSLVDGRGNRRNGFLRLYDIYNLNLNADLVVLSACRTGIGKDVKGEGLVGLARGFMYAGSKSVVASLWKVDDEATAELMTHFYTSMLKDGRPPAAALREAKKAMWEQERWRAPYFWAAFTLQGEYEDRPLGKGNGYDAARKAAAVILVIAFLAAGLFTVRRIRRKGHTLRASTAHRPGTDGIRPSGGKSGA